MSKTPPMPSRMTLGAEFMNRLNSGEIQQAAPEYVQAVRQQVCESLEELLVIGARIRPLYDGVKPIGWVRGIYVSERKQLQRWYQDPWDFATEMVLLGTSLTREEVLNLTGSELVRITRLMEEMSERDVSLFPYISAFVSTSTSENVWYAKGHTLACYENKVITFGDGKQIRLLTSSDHARLWTTLCHYRDENKRRVDSQWNALTMVRAWVGKSANGMESTLKKISKQLLPDAMEPWMNIVRVDRPELNDGWAHAEDDTREGLIRELKGMVENDRHEQLIAQFEKQQREAAEAQKRKYEEMIAKRGEGILDESVEVLTDTEVRRKERELRKARTLPVIPRSTEESVDPLEHLQRYQK